MNVKWLLRRWLLVVGVLLWPAVSQAAEVTVKMGISVGGDHLYVQMSKLMAKEIEKRVPGRVDWKLFPGAQLGRNDVIMRGLKTGTHIASMQASWIAAVVPAFELFEAPFMFSNREQVKRSSPPFTMNSPTNSPRMESFWSAGSVSSGFARSATTSVRSSSPPISMVSSSAHPETRFGSRPSVHLAPIPRR